MRERESESFSQNFVLVKKCKQLSHVQQHRRETRVLQHRSGAATAAAAAAVCGGAT